MTVTMSLDNVKVVMICELAALHHGPHWDSTYSTEWERGEVDRD